VTPEEDAYAAALSAAIAEDIAAHPPGGELVRVVLRWFEQDDPLHFTVHALGTDEAGELPGEDAWLPLEWPNADAEMERSDRLSEHPDVQRTGEALKATYEPPAEEEEEGACPRPWPRPALPWPTTSRRRPSTSRAGERSRCLRRSRIQTSSPCSTSGMSCRSTEPVCRSRWGGGLLELRHRGELVRSLPRRVTAGSANGGH
jgi:hypothetical protein